MCPLGRIQLLMTFRFSCSGGGVVIPKLPGKTKLKIEEIYITSCFSLEIVSFYLLSPKDTRSWTYSGVHT